MKEINNYIFEKLKLNKDIKIKTGNKSSCSMVGNIIDIPQKLRNKDDVIHNLLIDFVWRCIFLINSSKSPVETLNSTETYEKFSNKYCKINVIKGDFTEIYSNIPTDECTDIFKATNNTKMTVDEFKNMFGEGEFPVISVYSMDDYSQAYYTISR